MDRFYLLGPALLLLATLCLAFVVYCARCAAGRPPVIENVKHNQLFGPFFARFLVWMIGPLERLLIGRVSPNAVTAVALVLCGVTGAAVALGHLPGAVWLYVFAGSLDVLDGRLARMTHQQTAAGALFDSVSDRWGELFVFAGYVWFLHDSTWLFAVMAAIGGSMMVSYTRARAEGLGVVLTGGLMQRAERIALVATGTMIAAWYGSDIETASLVDPILGVTMGICGMASAGTAIHRWIVAYRELARRDEISADEAVGAGLAVPGAPTPARVLLPPRVRKVATIEQH
ncbi:MAG TPA: CDP-alcohol phosphatidyltransferase family protein [Kofleriaceae bacterium]|nr:CDP-alcohol phosphatidyltransferase family protein [Kofleriaceae bacterium]